MLTGPTPIPIRAESARERQRPVLVSPRLAGGYGLRASGSGRVSLPHIGEHSPRLPLRPLPQRCCVRRQSALTPRRWARTPTADGEETLNAIVRLVARQDLLIAEHTASLPAGRANLPYSPRLRSSPSSIFPTKLASPDPPLQEPLVCGRRSNDNVRVTSWRVHCRGYALRSTPCAVIEAIYNLRVDVSHPLRGGRIDLCGTPRRPSPQRGEGRKWLDSLKLTSRQSVMCSPRPSGSSEGPLR